MKSGTSTERVRCSAFIAVSVDGFIARENGDLDWLSAGGAEDYGYNQFMASVDQVVMGRHTFEKVLTFGAWPYAVPVLVLSTRKPEMSSTPAGVKFASGTPWDILEGLHRKGARNVYVDGGITIQKFLRAGAIDRLVISRIPVLLGRGIPLFGSLPGDIRLRHEHTESFKSGLVQSRYCVEPSADR